MRIELVNIKRENINLLKEIFEKNNSVKTLEKIHWQFLDTPSNKTLVDIAIDKEIDKVAAVYAVSPVHFQIGGSKMLACQSLDTMTDVDYRGKGLFVKLAKDVYEKATEDGLKLVYGFPNGNSIHGFVKKLEWQVLDPVPFLIKPLNSSYFTKKIKPLAWLPNVKIAFSGKKNTHIRIENNKEFPVEVNKIWGQFSKNIEVSVCRDKAYLDWRYLQKPDEDYQILHAYTEDNKYIGLMVYCIKEKHGGKIAYIMEYLFDPEFEKQAGELMKVALNNCILSKADCILSWCLEHSPNFGHHKKFGFFNMPEKLRPIELHFGVRAFDQSLANLINDRRNWYLSYSDSDTV